MKIGIVVGTRPEIIKMAPIVRVCVERGLPHAVIHTGQHYSWALDGVFFDELGLPAPAANLDVGSGSHAFQIGAIVSRIEAVLETERPDVVLVEGDTNSVLAAAIVANKMGIRVGHVEAGLRSYDRGMPEEINRVVVDHLADDLFAPTEIARDTLLREGLPEARIHVTGNTVVDELLYQVDRIDVDGAIADFGVERGAYALATVHRAENTNDPERLRGIFAGLAAAGDVLHVPVLAALHPRTAARLGEFGIAAGDAVRLLPPLPYLQFLSLHAAASLMLTDSGGSQEEACSLGVPCVTLRDNTERPESVAVGANALAGADEASILAAAVRMATAPRGWPNPFGDGRAAVRIIDALLGEPVLRAGEAVVAAPAGEATA